MSQDPRAMSSSDSRPGTAAAEPPSGRVRRGSRRLRHGTGAGTAHVRERAPHAVGPADHAVRPAEPGSAFSSVVCGVDRSAGSRAAHDQARRLAASGGTVELVPFPELTRHGRRGLHDGCDGHDLLVLGAGAAACAAVEHAPIPILIARWCPLGTEVTDTILVVVDDSPDCRRAVELAGRLAAVHGGTVALLGTSSRDPALQRAIAASHRILVQDTAAAPRLIGERLPHEHAIASAAADLGASLVILGCGTSDIARRTTAQIAGCVGCSVLAVPTLQPAASDPSACSADCS